jgi:CRISPR/Cas system-associated exonuclease Cas4 (RecB family)
MVRDHIKKIHDMTLRQLLGTGTLGDIAKGCHEALLFVEKESTARHHPLFRPYAETIGGALRAVAESALSDATFPALSAGLAVLRQCLRTAEVPFPGTPLNGLQVLGFLETRNLRFDTVYILDTNEGILPAGGSEHRIIPEHVREGLGLSHRREREEISEYYFNLLIAGAGTVHIFFSDDPQKERSRFVERLLWERQRRENRSDTREYIKTIAYSVQLANTLPAPIPKTPQMVTSLEALVFSATALDTYLACPLRFYYRYVLGLRERDEMGADIDAGDVGGFVHDVLRAYFSASIGTALTSRYIDIPRLHSIIDTMFEKAFGGEMTGSRYVLKKQVSGQLSRFLEQYQRPKVEHGEIKLLALEEKFSINRGKFQLYGKLDRVEQRDDRVYIMDYKTGSPDAVRGVDFGKLDPVNRETWRKAISSLQLPFYAMLYSSSTGQAIERIIPAYLKLGQSDVDENIEYTLFDGGITPAAAYRIIEPVVDSLLQEIADIDVPFHATDNPERDCVYCPFQAICGTQWTQRMSRS